MAANTKVKPAAAAANRGSSPTRAPRRRAGTAASSPTPINILAPATAFVDGYLDALCAFRPHEGGRTPCLGYGRGGVAYTLLKAGLLRGDPALVASAARWAASAIRDGLRSRARGWPRASFGRGLAGLHAIHALAARAAGDGATCRRELGRFAARARRGRGSLELLGGAAGRLAGAAIVLRDVPAPEVRALGDALAARVVAALAARAGRLEPPGLAHGWAGVALAALAWQAAARSLPEDALARAVIALHPYDVSAFDPQSRLDWAHGHAGMAHLFARAYLLLGDRRFLAWAREAAAQALARPTRDRSLVSGATGIAYAMLAVAAADPGGPWREAAWTIAGQVLAVIDLPPTNPHGVWSGLGGVCCLALDLIHGTEGRFPGIEA